jgi:hypothetical protein
VLRLAGIIFGLLALAVTADGLRSPQVQIVSRILAGGIQIYQDRISPLLHLNHRIQFCRFTPTCSEYMRQSLLKYGLFPGLARGTWRIIRCNPWNPGGFDPP